MVPETWGPNCTPPRDRGSVAIKYTPRSPSRSRRASAGDQPERVELVTAEARGTPPLGRRQPRVQPQRGSAGSNDTCVLDEETHHRAAGEIRPDNGVAADRSPRVRPGRARLVYDVILHLRKQYERDIATGLWLTGTCDAV
jgi:hypothetical protein